MIPSVIVLSDESIVPFMLVQVMFKSLFLTPVPIHTKVVFPPTTTAAPAMFSIVTGAIEKIKQKSV